MRIRIKGEDNLGVTHWLTDIGRNSHAWNTEIHATEFPLAIANKLVADLNQRNFYIDADLRIVASVVKD